MGRQEGRKDRIKSKHKKPSVPEGISLDTHISNNLTFPHFFENYAPTSQKKQFFSVLNTNKLMLFREISAMHPDNDMIASNVHRGYDLEFFNDKFKLYI
jgi:phospholipase C